jgi:dolichyl-phosphate beta-glucosyltransferase
LNRRRALIVVPAYKESRRLPVLLAQIRADPTSPVEIKYLIVDDGGGPREWDALLKLIRESGLQETVAAMRLQENAGKGFAIRAGFKSASRDFDYIGFIDADGSVSIGELTRAMSLFDSLARSSPAAGVVGSRIKIPGRDVKRSLLRRFLGRGFAAFVRLIFGLDVYDPQCGLKIFKTESVLPHLDVPSDTRWVWDTELLISLAQSGERIDEIPIDWHETPGGTLSLALDPAGMAVSLLKFKLERMRREVAG